MLCVRMLFCPFEVSQTDLYKTVTLDPKPHYAARTTALNLQGLELWDEELSVEVADFLQILD